MGVQPNKSRWSILRRDFGCVKGAAMVIPEARCRLHKEFDDLITGRITNWKFDPLYYELHDSDDLAVAEIANFGWGLYHDTVGPYRITKHYRISPEARKMADRCLLFLKTNLEYGWPDWPKQSLRSLVSNWLSVAIALPIVLSLLLACTSEDGIFASFFACGLMFSLLVYHLWLWFFPDRQNSSAWKEFWASGDKDAWPFLWRSEYQDALQTVSQSAARPVE